LFRKSDLRERKRAGSNRGGKDPERLEYYMAKCWEPTRQDLEVLRDAVGSYADKFNTIYQPIRHLNFAHRGKVNAEGIEELFGKTQIAGATEILRFVYTLVFVILEIYLNGTKPDQTDFHKYDSYVKSLNDQTEKLILSLS
jgi:hypothetical protein